MPVSHRRMAALVCWLLSLGWPNSPPPRQSKYRLPLPLHCQATLTAEELAGRPIFMIGDVHGCLDELTLLMAAARSRQGNPFFIFVGDMVNKGPANIDVLRLVRELTVRGQAAAVRGNHEESVLRELWAMSRDPSYKLEDRHAWIAELTQEDFKYLQELPYILTVPSANFIVIHAGLVPGLPLEQQSLEDLTHMRNIIQEDFFEGRGLLASSKIDRGVPWASLWPGPEHVYFGHDARRGLQQWPHATGLDTGCLYGKNLTGVFVGEETDPISIKALKTYIQP